MNENWVVTAPKFLDNITMSIDQCVSTGKLLSNVFKCVTKFVYFTMIFYIFFEVFYKNSLIPVLSKD